MTKIKICGLFRDADIDAVNTARPDYIGFVFAPSRRQVTPAQARAMRRRLDPAIVPVGVFVNAPIELITNLYREGTIAMAQLHGQEDEETIRHLKQVAGLPVIKAVRVAAATDILSALPTAADYLLLDNGPGGTGQTFDWRLIPPLEKPCFLAGGIGEHNVAAALALPLKPYCIDVSSGAETDGCKDPAKILRLVRRVREE